MGNSTSRPEEQIFKATVANDVVTLTKVIQAVQARGGNVREVLQGFKDKEGRTALLLACARNHHHCARVLLDSGADVHYLNPCVHAAGTALHEATRHRHEAMAEMLLACGASPFQSNGAGKTCMEEAVMEGAGNLLQRFKQLAIWQGNIAVKLSRVGGLSQPFKPRHIMLVPYITFPTAQAPSHYRCQMWVFKDVAALVPKSRLWIDGAMVTRVSQVDLVLRLHTTHKVPPGDLYTRYDRGYCVYLRASNPTSPQSLLELDELQGFVASGTFTELRPLLRGDASANAGASPGGSAGSSAAGAVHWARAPSYMPAMPSLTASFTSSSAPSTAAPPSTSASYSTPSGSGGGIYASVPQPQLAGPPAVLAAAAITAAAAAAPPLAYSASFGVAPSGSGGGQVGATARGNRRTLSDLGGEAVRLPLPPAANSFVDSMHALPGESDSEFAARLASAISVQDQPTAHAAATALAPCSASTHPSGAAAAPPLLHLGAAHVWGAAAVPASAIPTSLCATSGPAPPALPLVPVSSLGARGAPESPSAPPLNVAPAAGPTGMSGGSAGTDQEERQCVVCLSAAREVGFLHGASVHVSVCRECCAEFAPGSACPLCRAPIERVLNVF